MVQKNGLIHSLFHTVKSHRTSVSQPKSYHRTKNIRQLVLFKFRPRKIRNVNQKLSTSGQTRSSRPRTRIRCCHIKFVNFFIFFIASQRDISDPGPSPTHSKSIYYPSPLYKEFAKSVAFENLQ